MNRIFIVLAVMSIFVPTMLFAADFDPNFIITDQEITDHDSMTIQDIDAFLRTKGSSLSYLYPADYDGITRTVPEIIWLASQRYFINPKYALALLQKEQSLIEKATPTQRDLDWATGYGVCDSCTTTDPAIQKFKGFGKQIDNGVGFMRFFLDNPQKTSPFIVATPIEVTDYNGGAPKSYTITPVNQATANLYKYTPHYSGNLSFWNIWQDYFSQEYPNGTLVKLSDDPTVWLIQNGLKRKFKSFAILTSRYNPKKIVTITKADLDSFDEGPQVNFPQFSYVRSPSGTVYLLIDDMRFGFASQEALRIVGVNPEEIVSAEWADLEAYQEGKSITADSTYPTGALLQDTVSGGVFYVQNGVRSPIWSKEILASRYPRKRIAPVHPDVLATYEIGAPVTFSDGELVRSEIDPAVFVIENGTRRPIVSGERFEELGFIWTNVIITTEQALLLHPLGEPLA